MKRSEIRELLERLEIQPSRKLGQNFLCDPNAAGWIARQIDPQPEDIVIEPGAGLGSVTTHLIGRVKKLVLLEKDGRLAQWLRERAEGRTDVEVIEGDACDYDYRHLFAEGPVKMVGNLPYSAGTAILTYFLGHPTPVTKAVFMLQKEMAYRLSAKPRTKAFGALTLRVQHRWEVEFLRNFGPDLFLPRPEVDSSVISLTARRPDAYPPFDRELYARLVNQGFTQRRKQMRKLLTDFSGGDVGGFLESIDHSPSARAEELSVMDWITLTRAHQGIHNGEDKGQSPDEIFDVVDEYDEVIEQKPRSVVHQNSLKHRAVHIMVLNKVGEVYLQKRSYLKDKHPEKWDSSAAGHVDAGESYEATASRELTEELGITSEVLTAVAKLVASEKTDEEFITIFETSDWNGKIKMDPREIDSGGWFSQELVDRWIKNRPDDFATGFREVWSHWYQPKKND